MNSVTHRNAIYQLHHNHRSTCYSCNKAAPPSNTDSKKGRSSQAIYVSPIRENANGGGGKWNGIPFFATFGNRCLLEVAGHVFFIM